MRMTTTYLFSPRFHADAAYPRGHAQWFSPAKCVQAAAGYQLCVRDSRFFSLPGSNPFLLPPGAGESSSFLKHMLPLTFAPLSFIPWSFSPHWISCLVICPFRFLCIFSALLCVSLLGGKRCMRCLCQVGERGRTLRIPPSR